MAYREFGFSDPLYHSLESSIDSIEEPSFLKGLCFEYLVGLWYQQTRGADVIIPQARLCSENKSHTYMDFYHYNPRLRDGEIIEVRWQGDRKSLDSLVNTTLQDARYEGNSYKNTGRHVNIDIARDRSMTLVVHKKVDFAHPKVEYLCFEEICPDLTYMVVNRMISNYSADTSQMRQMAKTLYSMMVQGFETGRAVDLAGYAHYLNQPRSCFFGVVQAEPGQLPKGCIPVRDIRVNGEVESRLFYSYRGKNGNNGKVFRRY